MYKSYIVWDVAQNIIPTLTTQINEVITAHQADENIK